MTAIERDTSIDGEVMSLREEGIILVRGTTYFLVARIITSAFSLFTSIILARYLGSSGYGLWSLAWSTFNIFLLLEGLPGSRAAMIRYVSKYEAENKPGLLKHLAMTTLKLRMLITGVLCIFTLLASNYVAKNVSPTIALLFPIFIIGHFMSTLDLSSVLNALKKFHYEVSLGILGAALRFFFITIFLVVGYGIIGAAVGHALHTVAISIIAFSLVFTRFLPSESHSSGESRNFFSTSKQILVYGLPLSISGLMISFSTYFMNFMLGLKGLEALGYFAVALAITNMTKELILLVRNVLFPIISELETKGYKERIEKLLSILSNNMLILAATVVIFTELFAPQIIYLIYSKEFEPAVNLLRILIVINIPAVFASLSGTVFKGTGRSDLILKISILSLFWKIPAIAFLIPSFGVMGATTIILIANFGSGLILSIYFLMKTVGGIPFKLKPMVRLVPALGFLTIILLLIRPFINNVYYIIPLVLLTLPASFILACLSGSIKKGEIDILQNSLPADLQQNLHFIFAPLKKICRE